MARVFANVEWVRLDRADGRLFGVLFLHRHAGRHARAQLVHHADPLPGHPPHPRQRLHHLHLQRADRQGRDGLLPEPARQGAGLGSRLGDAVRDVLRDVLPAVLGDGRLPRQRILPAAGIRPHPLARRRRGAGLRRLGPVLPGHDPGRPAPAGAADPTRIPSGETQALCVVPGAPLAGAARGGGRVHHGAAPVRRRRVAAWSCWATCRSSSSPPPCRRRCAPPPSRPG